MHQYLVAVRSTRYSLGQTPKRLRRGSEHSGWCRRWDRLTTTALPTLLLCLFAAQGQAVPNLHSTPRRQGRSLPELRRCHPVHLDQTKRRSSTMIPKIPDQQFSPPSFDLLLHHHDHLSRYRQFCRLQGRVCTCGDRTTAGEPGLVGVIQSVPRLTRPSLSHHGAEERAYALRLSSGWVGAWL